ncbi:MAG: hypothetical protein KAI55_03245 [Candidatus Aenigmarchaeota archaeon]|nr:hypothetical protein [Candidatus Aenigmarchaeota archaeon]
MDNIINIGNKVPHATHAFFTMKKQAKTKFIPIIFFLSLIFIGVAFFIQSNYFDNNENKESITNIFTKSNVSIVENILQEYHEDHIYSITDFFVCGDMSMELWNILKSKGFDSKIKIGNVDNNTIGEELNFTQYNHAWVMAKIDNEWFALETTGGFIADEAKYPLYYRKTIEFSTPFGFKNYLDLIKKYNVEKNISESIYELCNEYYNAYSKEYNYHNSLIREWNEKYASKVSSKEAILFSEKIDGQNIIVEEKENIYEGCSLTIIHLQSTMNETYEMILNIDS